jgi:hypothetical protein
MTVLRMACSPLRKKERARADRGHDGLTKIPKRCEKNTVADGQRCGPAGRRLAAGRVVVADVEDLERLIALRDLDAEAVLGGEAVEAARRDDPDAVRLRDAGELGSHAPDRFKNFWR